MTTSIMRRRHKAFSGQLAKRASATTPATGLIFRPQQEIARIAFPLIACWARRAQLYSGSLAPRADLFDWVVRAPLL